MKKTFLALVLAFAFIPFSGVVAADEQSRFVQQCTDAGDTETNCEEREALVRGEMPALKKAKRMDFVQMIVKAKRYCRAEHAESDNARLCFRIHVRDDVKEMILNLRELKKDCRKDGKVGIEIFHCAYSEYLDFESETEEENNEEENNEEEEGGEEESGENEEENEGGEENENEEEENGNEEENNEEEEETAESTLRLEYSYDADKNITFTWETEEISSCVGSSSPANSDWDGEKSAIGGTEVVENVTEVTTFTLTCASTISGADDIVVSDEIDTSN